MSKKIDDFEKLKFGTYLIKEGVKIRRKSLTNIANKMKKYVSWATTEEQVSVYAGKKTRMISFTKVRDGNFITCEISKDGNYLFDVNFSGESRGVVIKILDDFCKNYGLTRGWL